MANLSAIAAINPIGGAGAGISGASGIGGIGSLGGGLDVAGAAGPTGLGSANGTGSGATFLDSLGDALGALNTQITTADAAAADFAAGGSGDLHTVMLQMQEASIGLQVGLQVRDRLLEAYHELMRLQV
jgi:flagellar hook-basal body complex protein FliE